MQKQISKKKKTVSIIAVICVVLLASFTLVKERNRTATYTLPPKVAKQVVQDTKGMNERAIINYSLNKTSEKLSFTRRNNINKGEANCVGYAQFCSAVCNKALSSNKINGIATPVVGHINAAGINLCKTAESMFSATEYKNFVKDHDFVEMKTRNKTYQFDPCLYDLVGISCYTEKQR